MKITSGESKMDEDSWYKDVAVCVLGFLVGYLIGSFVGMLI